jgi:hypothetical protein
MEFLCGYTTCMERPCGSLQFLLLSLSAVILDQAMLQALAYNIFSVAFVLTYELFHSSF